MGNKNIKELKKLSADDEIFDSETKSHKNYEIKVFIFSMLIFLLFALGFILLSSSIKFNEEKVINYRENSNIDYKVYLKDNDFYDNKYLDKGMVYVANLIDHVTAQFYYKFNIDEKSNITFEYDAIAKLLIKDRESDKTYFEKDYTLLKKDKEIIKDKDNFNLNKSVKIDYNYYNDLANEFRQKYGLDTKSDVVVNLRVTMRGYGENDINLSDSSTMSLTIPLSKSAVNINLSSNELNKSKDLVSKDACRIINYKYLYISIALFVVALMISIILIRYIRKIKGHKSEYDKYVDKILNEYDRLIVETTSKSNITNKNVIKINEFKELLDVRDNLNLPIKYYVVAKHEECEFYIDHEDEIYIYSVKAIDINSK